MKVTARKVAKEGPLGLIPFVVSIVTAVSQADVIAEKIKPGFDFEIVRVENWARTEAGAVSCDVKIGATSALSAALAFATATRGEATLSATQANRRGDQDAEINVHYTSDGTGALTNGHVTVWIRPFPMHGDVPAQD